MNLLDAFDRAYVINLPERLDRRREVEAELRRPELGLRQEQLAQRVRFHAAAWPATAAPFASLGTKGCSHSHRSVLREAEADGLESVLVLEDDAQFEAWFPACWPDIVEQLAGDDWSVAQLGYDDVRGVVPRPAQRPHLVEFSGAVRGSHCYAVRGPWIGRLAEHFERQACGRPGDPVLGPMASDGTLNTFPLAQPEARRLLAVPSVCRQRSSRSDVNPGRFDRYRPLRPVLSAARRVRRTVGRRSAAG